MLVLSRKSHQSVVVGSGSESARLLKITVLEIHANRVSLGFEGDAAITVNRLEVWARKNVTGLAPEMPNGTAAPQDAARWSDDGGAETAEVPPRNHDRLVE
jgi:sRNA-binding carbon storage regulator CsrA